jgi:hypothetical protein
MLNLTHAAVAATIAVLTASLGTLGCSGSSPSPVDPGTGDAGPADADAGSSAGSDDGGATPGPDAGDAGSSAQPIVAPPDEWTWVDFPDSRCASGTPTGMGINPHAGATDVLVFFEGGGACTTGVSCWGKDPSAANVDGYDATTFAAAQQRKYPALSRAIAANPFKAVNMVYVPYCTGDLHAGTAVADLKLGDGTTKPTYFWGAKDLEMFLARVAPTFPQAKHVWVMGTSAGGFGTYLTFDRVAKAFGGVRVDIIDDSGPAMSPKGATKNAALGLWGFVPPAGCSPCETHAEVLASARAAQPASKYAFLSYERDPTIAADMGYALDEYPAALGAFVATLKGDLNAATFMVTNDDHHVVQTTPALALQYLPWFTKMMNDDPAWGDVTYAVP